MSASSALDSGYTLPVWVAVAAVAAVRQLRGDPPAEHIGLELLQPAGQRELPIEAVAPFADGSALAISRCDPGPGMDLTRGLAVWVRARWSEPLDGVCFDVQAGAGVGRLAEGGEVCLSGFARDLLQHNLVGLVPDDRSVALEVVLPQGRERALRTSNAAFGVVEGLALIGTQAEVQRSAAPDQLQGALDELRQRAERPEGCPELVLVVGENGLDLAPRLGLSTDLLLKSGNWIGPLLAAAAEQGGEAAAVIWLPRQIAQIGGRHLSHPPPLGRWPR